LLLLRQKITAFSGGHNDVAEIFFAPLEIPDRLLFAAASFYAVQDNMIIVRWPFGFVECPNI
jgi:hypothetical protein